MGLTTCLQTLVGVLLLFSLGIPTAKPAGAQSGPSEPVEPPTVEARVELRVWQAVSNPLRLFLSARPEGGDWGRTLALPMDATNARGTYRYSDQVVAVPLASGDTADVELRVWQHVSDPRRVYLSARPSAGEWGETERLGMDAMNARGTFRYSDRTVAVPVPDAASGRTPELVPSEAAPATDEGEARVCRWAETTAMVVASTVKVTTPSAIGTAFYVGEGQFVTAGHVVDERPAWITLRNEHVNIAARLVGFYGFEDGDVAVLAASAPRLTPLLWAGAIPQGAEIAIVGYGQGFGLGAAITRGHVSRLLTSSAGISEIQTDAASNPGNSGGPLVDACGRVAGVVSSSHSATDAEGIHFAIAEPTLSQKLVALGLQGYAVAPGGTAPESETDVVTTPPTTVGTGWTVTGTADFRFGWNDSRRAPSDPNGVVTPSTILVVAALVGGTTCDTDTAVKRFGNWSFTLTIPRGCGGAELGSAVSFTVNGSTPEPNTYVPASDGTRWWDWSDWTGNRSEQAVYWGTSPARHFGIAELTDNR